MSLKKLSEDKMTGEIFLGYIGGSIVDSFIVMLALGGLSHQLHKPSLALAYWSCWLIVVIAYAHFDNGIGRQSGSIPARLPNSHDAEG